MHTRSLRSLVKVSQTRSFSDASEQLGMTLSALSMQIKALETALGVALFDRSVRPPRLTPVGRLVVQEAVPLLQHEDALIDVSRSSDDLVGRFKIGFVTTAAVRWLPNFVLAAKEHAPRAAFDFETGLSAALQEKVVAGQLDAAVITEAEMLPGDLVSHVLRREPFVFAAHDGLLGHGLEGLLAENTFFHFMPHTGIGKLIARAMLAHARLPRAKTVVLDNLETIMECVSAGLGFTLLPVPDVERYRTPAVRTIAATSSLERRLVFAAQRGSRLAGGSAVLKAMEAACSSRSAPP
ncbi:MAG: LysR family transcriptional regulator [Pseudomonadota bacterium]